MQVKEAFDWLRGKLKSAKADLGNVRPKGMPDAPPRKQVAGSDGAPPAQSKDAPEPTPAASSAPKPTANGAGKTSARGPATATDPPPPKQPDPSGGGGHVVQNGGDDYAKSPSPEGIDPGTPQPPVRPVPDAKAPDAAPAGAGGGSERVRAQEPDVGGGERSGGGEAPRERSANEPTSGETSATRRGRQAHKDWDPGPGFEKEHSLPSGKRPDAINWAKREVVELKPNNPRQIRLGKAQVEEYRRELEAITGEKWTARVETYDP